MIVDTSLSRRSFLGAGGALFAFAAGITGPRQSRAAEQYMAKTRARAAAAVKDILRQKDIPSVSYALVGRDGLIWADAAGIVDASGRPPGADTLYCIGSCSKVVATTAMMQLIEQGKAALDDPLVKHVPEFRMLTPGFETITLRMLMNHSSGLPGSEYRGAICTAWNGHYAEAVLATAAQARLKHQPGEMSVYCNDGFTLLELVIRAITGKAYVDVVQQDILAPLGMARSGYGNRDLAPGSFAPGINDGRMLPREVVNCAASGGLNTTPTELARFLAVFLNEGRWADVQILAPQSVRSMGENQTARQPFLPVAATDGYGLGWDNVNPVGFAALGIKAWHKAGGTAVYSTDMIVLPEVGLAAVATGASSGFPAGMLAELILFSALAEQGTIASMPEPLTKIFGPPSGKPMDEAWFDGVFGSYDKVFRLVPDGKGGATQLQASNGEWQPKMQALMPREEGRVASDAIGAIDFSLRDYEGWSYLIARAALGYRAQLFELVVSQKLPPRGPVSSAWAKRLGRSWLLVNAPFEGFVPGLQSPKLRLDGYPELPGYVVLGSDLVSDKGAQPLDASTDDMRAKMCLRIPYNNGRDLNDVVVLPRGEEEWLQYGSWVARPLETVPSLGLGSRMVTIGPEGHAEWFRLSDMASLELTDATHWMLYDADFGVLATGDGKVTGLSGLEAAYLLVHGSAGAEVGLRLT